MKKLLLSTIFLLAAFLSTGVFTSKVKACDRSEINLDSVVVGPGYLDIYIQMSVGGGITGTSKGAGSDTRTFAYAFYSASPISLVSFTPQLVGDSTGGVYPGADIGAAFGANFVLGYIDTGTPYTCISTTASCGNKHTDVKQVFIRVDAIPDSVRLLGIEGSGNPFAGCYPDADMLLDFTILPVVWAGFNAKVEPQGVALDWATSVETNNDHFLVQRSGNGVDFETIATVAAASNSSKANSYDYVDNNPVEGSNFYKIVQVDIDGNRGESEVLTVTYQIPSGLFWTAVGPNPVESVINLQFSSEKTQQLTLQVIDIQGRMVRNQQVEARAGNNSLDMDLSTEANGFYFLRIVGASAKLEKKILKM